MKSDGITGFSARRLVETCPTRLAFAPTRAAKLLPLSLATASLLVALSPLFTWSLPRHWPSFVILAVFSVVPAVLGALTWHFLSRPRVFDFAEGIFWVGTKRKADAREGLDWIRLGDVYALQIVQKRIRLDRGFSTTSYKGYELNIVTRDGTRMHVVNDGRHPGAIATQLSQRLRVPVWDAS